MLFIDANAYLEFFSSSKAQVKKLLPSLQSIKGEIFVTEQVVNEVVRNRLNVAAASLTEYFDAYKMRGVRLPEHLEGPDDKALAEWNKAASKLADDVKENRDKLAGVAYDLLAKIMRGEDAASVILGEIFEGKIQPTDAELERARRRKEVGNPPGKIDDPLGDQVSWEQIVASYDGSSPLWIISKDNDYSVKIGKERYLNGFLWTKLRTKINKPIDVRIFDTLADGIADYSNTRASPVEKLPSADELKKIAEEELKKRYRADLSMSTMGPSICYRCGESEGFRGPVAKPSQYGGWSYQWLCNSCGEWNDFGEPYED